MQANLTAVKSKEEITLSEKSGKGRSDGVVSELTAIFTVKPGHAEQLRAACERFIGVIHSADPRKAQKIGLHDARFVLFDDDSRFLFATTFETDWDPYIDDAIAVFGIETWSDLVQHLDEIPLAQFQTDGSAVIKQSLQSVQAPAAGYANTLAGITAREIRKALRLEQVFQQVLDNPEAGQALQHPALQPLFELAAD